MRMEDLDHPRDKPGAAAAAIEDLKWLGFDWDDEYVQSERKPLYAAAIARLRDSEPPLVYPCACSRRDVESAQSAPHSGDQLFYPGTCRDRFATWEEARAAKSAATGSGSIALPPVWRFRVPQGARVSFDDVFAGSYSADVSSSIGDFPVARDEGGAGYTLAVVVDDAAMGVTEVVRGDDLLAATPPQILLQRALGLPTPSYLHVPLVVGPDGRRLAKRHGDTRIAEYRRKGVEPEQIIGALAATCGWANPGERVSLLDLVPQFDLSTIPRSAVEWPPHWGTPAGKMRGGDIFCDL